MIIWQGMAGYEVIERDRKGREIRALRDEEIGPRDGYNVVLTIDQVIQHIAEAELEKAMAAIQTASRRDHRFPAEDRSKSWR